MLYGLHFPFKARIRANVKGVNISNVGNSTIRRFNVHLQNVIMATGTVKWFNEKKGFGFIVDPQFREDIFVHFSEIRSEGFKTLQEGENVDYELFEDGKGAKARNVMRKA